MKIELKITSEQIAYLKSLDSKKKKRKFLLDCLVEEIEEEKPKSFTELIDKLLSTEMILKTNREAMGNFKESDFDYQQRIIKEATQRGFVNGVKFKSVEANCIGERIIIFGSMDDEFRFDGLDMYNSKGWVLKNGKWAKIIKKEKQPENIYESGETVRGNLREIIDILKKEFKH